jgi:hypothetical protein
MQSQFGRTVAIWLFALGCKKAPSAPQLGEVMGTATAPTLLSVGSPTKDEDPSVLLASDGTLYIAWFSDRGNNNDIYISRSTDRTTWSTPTRVTTSQWGDFYPTLIQDQGGQLHLVWFQWVAPFVGQIRHSSSTDGTTWAPEDFVTTEFLVDDWVPTVAQSADGSLLVYFVSEKRDATNLTNEIFVVRRAPGATRWEAPRRLTTVNSPTEHDQLPFAARIGNDVALAWVRYDTRDADFITNPKSELYYATSADGLTFGAPTRVTTESGNVANLFPQLFKRHDGSWAILWLSTRSGSPQMYELPVNRLTQYPAAVAVNTLLPAGYSHRVAATSRAGEYLAAWVQGPRGSEDIYYRYITR